MDQANAKRGALLALAGLTLIWSFNWVVMKWAMQFAGPFDFSALRYLLGTLVLFSALLLRGRSLKPPALVPVVLIGLAQTMGFQALVQWALVDGGAGKTALFAYTMPFWVALLGRLLLSDRLSARHVWGIVGAAIGLLLIIAPWQGVGGLKPVLLAIAGGFCWGLGTVLSKRQFQRSTVSMLSLTAWQMLFGTMGLVLLTLVVPERSIAWSPQLIGAIVYNGLLSSGLAWLLWSLIVNRLPAHVAGVSSLAIPVMGVGFAWVLLGERPGLSESIGIAFIVAALIAVNRRVAKRSSFPTTSH